MQDKLFKTTLALAGMVQAICQVKELAQGGKIDDAAFHASIESIFQMDAPSVAEVFGGVSGLRYGLTQLIRILNGEVEQGQPTLRYLMSMIHMEKKLRHIKPIQDNLKKRLLQAKKQAEYFTLTHPTVINNLADIYINAISSFHFRIIVWGNPRLLNTAEIMEKIRALLLAGIRATVLWRQVGGNRLQILFSRTKIKMMAKQILDKREWV